MMSSYRVECKLERERNGVASCAKQFEDFLVTLVKSVEVSQCLIKYYMCKEKQSNKWFMKNVRARNVL